MVDVWSYPDEAYRFPKLELSIGDNVVVTKNPPTSLQEITFSRTFSDLYFNVVMTLFDETWDTVAVALGLGVEGARQLKFKAAFGWPFEGGYIDNLEGRIDTVQYSIRPEGIAYTLNGKIIPRVQPLGDALPRLFKDLKIEELVRIVAVAYAGIAEDKLLIEDFDSDPQDWAVPASAETPFAFLEHLAEEMSKRVDREVRSIFDGEVYHFRTDEYKDHLDPVFSVTYPYPKEGNPVQELQFGDVHWKKIAFISDNIDRETGEPMSENQENDLFISVPVSTQFTDLNDFIKRMAAANVKIDPDRTIAADLTVLGNPFVSYGDRVGIEVIPPEQEHREYLAFLGGDYRVGQVTHSIAADTYITRLALTKLRGE